MGAIASSPRKKTGTKAAELTDSLPSHHEAFCQAVADGESATKAYQQHVSGWQCTDSTAATAAHLMLKEGSQCAQRVSDLKRENDAHVQRKLAKAKEHSIAYLTEGITMSPVDARLDHPHCELAMSKIGPYAKQPDKLACIKQLSTMCGWDAPQKQEITHGTTEDIQAAMEKMFAKEA